MREDNQPSGVVRRIASALTGSDNQDLQTRAVVGATFGLASLILFMSLAQFIEVGGEFVIAVFVMLSGTLFGACLAGKFLHYRTLRQFARYMVEEFDAFAVACICVVIWLITPT